MNCNSVIILYMLISFYFMYHDIHCIIIKEAVQYMHLIFLMVNSIPMNIDAFGTIHFFCFNRYVLSCWQSVV